MYSLTALVRYGRSAESPIQISDSSVSLRHVSLEWVDGSWFIEDLQSTNGTFVNGERVSRSLVVNGDIVYLGQFKLTFQDGELKLPGQENSTPFFATTNKSNASSSKRLVLAASLFVGLLVLGFAAQGRSWFKSGSTANATEATVLIVVSNSSGEDCWSGSGFVVGDGSMVVTNAHVAAPGSKDSYLEKQCTNLKVGYTTDDRKAPSIFRNAQVLEISEREDLALLKVNDPLKGVKSLELQNAQLSIGDSLTVFGYPALGGETITVSNGVVSGFDSSGGSELIKISAVINSGNSGGPVIDRDNKVIGVASAANQAGIECTDSGDCYTDGQNINLARPIKLVSDWLNARDVK
jgi:S1-C subfamily serine protease